MKINHAFKLLLFSLICLLPLASCTKEYHLPDDLKGQLLGSWTETPVDPAYGRVIFFGADDTFTIHFNGSATPNSAMTITGTYKVDGNKLDATVLEATLIEVNKAPVKIPYTGSFFDKATFKVDGNKLVIDYLTYPADGPVPTKSKFVKN